MYNYLYRLSLVLLNFSFITFRYTYNNYSNTLKLFIEHLFSNQFQNIFVKYVFFVFQITTYDDTYLLFSIGTYICLIIKYVGTDVY